MLIPATRYSKVVAVFATLDVLGFLFQHIKTVRSEERVPSTGPATEVAQQQNPQPAKDSRRLFHSANLALDSVLGGSCESCGDTQQGQGSWDNQFRCSEQGGGVHQICYRNIRNSGLSAKTGQPNWSDDRCEDCNHCVCLGAWALYVAKGGRRLSRSAEKWRELRDKDFEPMDVASKTPPLKRLLLSKKMPHNMLKCTAIPETALQYRYVNNWNTWNGHELPNQVIDGVEELVAQCLEQSSTANQKKHLTDLYCGMALQTSSLNTRPAYNELCKGAMSYVAPTPAASAQQVSTGVQPSSTTSTVNAQAPPTQNNPPMIAAAPGASGSGAVSTTSSSTGNSVSARQPAAASGATSAERVNPTSSQDTRINRSSSSGGQQAVQTNFKISSKVSGFNNLIEARAVLHTGNTNLVSNLCRSFVQTVGASSDDCVVNRIVVTSSRRSLGESMPEGHDDVLVEPTKETHDRNLQTQQFNMQTDISLTAQTAQQASMFESRVSTAPAVVEASMNQAMPTGVLLTGSSTALGGRTVVSSGSSMTSFALSSDRVGGMTGVVKAVFAVVAAFLFL
ncbi:unnamed protein product [Amoebophrya sp. A120]|nr:unnamed protein product [Amoebophrya sp. A120]|eukprot:GSA120T00020481001.1